MKIGLIILSDTSTDKQKLLEAEVERVVTSFFMEPPQLVTLAVPHEREQFRAAIVRLCDQEKCPLVLTAGGVGPTERDIAPDVTLQVVDRALPGFGEIMRYYSYERFKVSALSRATAGVRGKSLVINLPGRPKPVKFCLRLLQEPIVEALELITGIRPELKGDEVVIPLEKYLPFLKYIRPKVDPNGPQHPTL